MSGYILRGSRFFALEKIKLLTSVGAAETQPASQEVNMKVCLLGRSQLPNLEDFRGSKLSIQINPNRLVLLLKMIIWLLPTSIYV